MKLSSLSKEYLEVSATHLTRIHYKPPVNTQPGMPMILSGLDLFKIIWEDTMMMDEESGSNRQLGFVFLYELLRGKSQSFLTLRRCSVQSRRSGLLHWLRPDP